MQDFLLPLAFGVNGCETSFHFCFLCACLVQGTYGVEFCNQEISPSSLGLFL